MAENSSKAQSKKENRFSLEQHSTPIRSSKYEIESVIGFAKELGEEFINTPLEKLVYITQRKFGNASLLHAITALYRAGIRSQKELADMVADSSQLSNIARKATRVVAARNIIGQLKQLGFLDAVEMSEGFSRVRKHFDDFQSEQHAQSFAVKYALGVKGYKVGFVSNKVLQDALSHLNSARLRQVEFNIQIFAEFFSSDRVRSTDPNIQNTSLSNLDDAQLLAWPYDKVIQPIKLSWRILGPGEHSFNEVLILCENIQARNNSIQFDVERLQKIYDIGPSTIYFGIDEFEGYVVFYFQESSTAILECPLTGNAVYVIKGDWQSLSRLSKTELLTHYTGAAQRVIHSGDWFSRLKALLE